jgi:hypothetical protein
MIEDFFHLPTVSTTPVVHLELRILYLRKLKKKIWMALMVYSGAWGKLNHEKKQKSKISWHCPFKHIWPIIFPLFLPSALLLGTFWNCCDYHKRINKEGKIQNIWPVRCHEFIDWACLSNVYLSPPKSWPVNWSSSSSSLFTSSTFKGTVQRDGSGRK